MLGSFLKTLWQIKDPKILKALVISTILTLGTIILVIVLGATLLHSIMDAFSKTLVSWFGAGEGWFRGFIQFLAGSAILILSYFLFAGIHGAFVGIFIDDIFDAIHQRHYPDVQWNRPPPSITSCLFSARILLLTVLLNILASPILIMGWFIPPLGLALQIFLNGYLLGKEYGQLVEFRFPKEHSLTPAPKYFSNGNIAAIIWIIPVVNLIAPILLAGSVLHTRMKLITK
jgi:uncharacterized protein involved in cysteine biosynthesis